MNIAPAAIDCRLTGERPERAGKVLVVSFALFLVAALPVLLVKIPPFEDYPNHLARIFVIAQDGNDPVLSKFYSIDWKIIPNLAMDLAVPPLARITGVFWAGKIFILAILALMMSGVQAVHFALFRRLSMGPAVAVLFFYNYNLSLGLVNYLFGVGLALWGFAAWIALRRSSPALRLSISLGFVVALFICHLAAVGLYGLAIFSFEVWRLLRSARSTGAEEGLFSEIGVLVLPFLAVPALLAAGPTGKFASAGGHWVVSSKGRGLWYILKTFYYAHDIAFGVLIAVCIIWAWRHRLFRLHPAGWIVLACAVPLYLALPASVMSATHVDDRLPIGFLFILLSLIVWEFSESRRQRAFVIAVAMLGIWRIAGVGIAFPRMNDTVAQLEQSELLIPPGSKILVATGRTNSAYFGMQELFAEAIILRSSLVSVVFAHKAQQVLVVKAPYDSIARLDEVVDLTVAELIEPSLRTAEAPHSRIYWSNWAVDYDYLYVAGGAAEPNPAPDRLSLLYRTGDFQLYKVNHSS